MTIHHANRVHTVEPQPTGGDAEVRRRADPFRVLKPGRRVPSFEQPDGPGSGGRLGGTKGRSVPGKPVDGWSQSDIPAGDDGPNGRLPIPGVLAGVMTVGRSLVEKDQLDDDELEAWDGR